MAEENEETTGTPEAAPAKSRKKLLLIIAGVVLLLVAIGVPVTIMSLKKSATPAEELDPDAAGGDAAAPEGADDEDELDEGEEALGALFPLETFVVNLKGGSLIRCQVQLEFTGRDVPRRFYSKLVPTRDALIALLAKRTQEDALSEEGRTALKGDMKEAVNELLKKEEVRNVYFTQFVVQ